jgi:hypothetical protein
VGRAVLDHRTARTPEASGGRVLDRGPGYPPASIRSHEEQTDRMEWEMECREKGSPPMTGNGRIISHGDTFDGEMNVSMKVADEEMKFQTKWNGKRIGECGKD